MRIGSDSGLREPICHVLVARNSSAPQRVWPRPSPQGQVVPLRQQRRRYRVGVPAVPNRLAQGDRTFTPLGYPGTASLDQFAATAAARAGHLNHVLLLRPGDHVDQTTVRRVRGAYARRVIAAVQRPLPRFQRDPVACQGNCIPSAAEHGPFRTAAPDPKPRVSIGSDRAHPDRAIVGVRPAHIAGFKARDFVGMAPAIHHQP